MGCKDKDFGTFFITNAYFSPLQAMKNSGQQISENAIRLLKMHEKLISYFQKYLNDKQFVIISGVLIGITSGLAAILLKAMVFYINAFCFQK
ncbi:MAG: hypothetical protein IPL12_23810 [Bacteroidetes bacterium]|nr:hypothetical protein [Bacteroidota bacterium]